MTRDNFYETYGHANYYLDPTRPVVERINVNYREKEKPYLNQRDVSPICFLQMLEAAKEIEREKTSHLDEQIQAANVEAEQENSEKDTGKESVSLDDFSRDIS